MSALSPRVRALLYTLGAVLALASLVATAVPYGNYTILYGRFGWGPFETGFLVNYLVFGTTAVGLLGAALALVGGNRLVAGFDRLERLSAPARTGLGAGALVAIAGLIAFVRLYLLRDTAITDDENVYVFMARVLATGRLSVPSPPADIRPFFDNQFMINDGKWYGMFFPGHGALLAVGAWLGAVRWVPTVSALVTALLAYLTSRRLFGPRAAPLTLLLLLVSPYFVMSSATLLAHSTSALFLMTATYALLRGAPSGASVLWWLAAGLALGGTGLTRPLAGLAFAIPWLGWLAARLMRQRTPRRALETLLVCAGGALGVLALLGYHWVLTGHPLRTAYQHYSALYGFPIHIGALPAPMPLPMIYELGFTFERLNFWLFGWPLSLVLLPFFRRCAESVVLALATGAVIVAYAATTLPTINATGPAHYSELAAPLVMLSASGLDQLIQRLRAAAPGRDRLVLGTGVAAVLCAALVFWPVYGGSLRAMSVVARAPYDLVERRGLERAVIFVHSLPSLTWHPGAWVYFQRNNRPDLSDPVLFVKDLGSERNQVLARALPDRVPYVMGTRDRELILAPLNP